MVACAADVAAVVEALAVLVGVGVAYRGLTAWRPQIRGQAEYDVARKILLAANRFRVTLASVRGPFMTGGEMVAALMEDGMPRKEAQEKASDIRSDEGFAMAYNVRWKAVDSARVELETAVIEGVVHWGDGIDKAAAELRKCAASLRVAVGAVLRDKSSRGERATERNAERMRTHEEVMYGGADWPNDAYSRTVDQAVAALDALVRPYLK